MRGHMLNSLMQRLRLAHWRRAAELAGRMTTVEVRALRTEARQVRREIDRVLAVADHRLTLPMIGSTATRRQMNTDWSWRPNLWRMPMVPVGIAAAASPTNLDAETSLHHDCQDSEVTLRQIRNTRAGDLAPFGLRMDVFRFDGTFLSLSVKLPDAAVGELRLRHLVRLDAIVETEKPVEILARLNVRHGPNTEQFVLGLSKGDGEKSVDFDLAQSKISEKRIERAWVDLIFEAPEMNQIVLRDVAFSRRPRAEM